jgi:hypothetical protein
MLYVLKREQIEHARLRALAQAIIQKEKGKEVFDDYMNVAFPWLATSKRQEKNDHIRLLMEEVKKGQLGIKPLWQETRGRSRLRTRVVERAEKQATPQARQNMNRLYSKLGKIVPV